MSFEPRPPYKTLGASIRHEIDPVKNSRFIVDVRPVSDEAGAKQELAGIRAEFDDANHHCWAYALRDPARIKSSDDGEPGGSAGRPILATLTGREVVDVLAVVTRYFGGTKLGVGGLMRAYSGAAAEALDRADIITITPKRALWIEHAYEDTTPVEMALKGLGLCATTSDYAEHVTVRLEVSDIEWPAVRETLTDQTGGRIRFLDDREDD